MHLLRLVLICFSLYLLSVSTRFIGVQHIGLQSDERLWASRSHELLKRYRDDLRHLTSHLPHPGIPAAAVLAVGHSFREMWNERYNCQPADPCFISVAKAGRVSVTLAVSLIIPIIFLGLSKFIGTGCAFVTAFLLALDPRFLSNSRLIHVDGMLTLVFTIAFLLYLHGITSNRGGLVLGAGIFWGLSILSKPSGVLLVPILIAYRMLRKFFLGALYRIKNIYLWNWYDIWAVIIAHATIVLLFTRLWDKESRYISVLGVKSPFARNALQLGNEIQSYWPYFLLGFLLISGLIIYFWRHSAVKHSSFFKNLANSYLILSLVTGFYLAYPLIVRNLILYWTWVSGLSGVKHDSYGHIIEETAPYGYLYILYGELPDEIVFGVLYGALIILLCLFRYLFRRRPYENLLAWSAIILAPVIFIAFLSTSSKQGFRYVLPILPCIYALAVIGFRDLASKFIKYTGLKHNLVLIVGALLLFASAFERLYNWYPFYPAYFNRISGGLEAAVNNNRGFFLVGDIQAAHYLLDQVATEKQPLNISIAGDRMAMEANVARIALNRGQRASELRFGRFMPEFSDYLMTYASHPFLVPREFRNIIENTQPEYSTSFKGVDLVKLYRVQYKELEAPYKFNLSNAHSHTGALHKGADKVELVAKSKRHKPGYLFYIDGIKLTKANYNLIVKGQVGPALIESPAENIIQLELNGACSVEEKFLLVKGPFEQLITCKLNAPGKVVPRVYWPGGYDLVLSSVLIEEQAQ